MSIAEAAVDRRRTSRPTRIGRVMAHEREKTIKVSVGFAVRHAKYGKYLRRSTVLHVHDEKNEARTGDTVEIAECRPISKTKNWRLIRVVARGAGGESA